MSYIGTKKIIGGYVDNVGVSKIYAGNDIVFQKEAPLPKLPVGGRIFYIHNDNGVTYHFFDTLGNELTNHTVAGLANAATYTIEGEPTADKFYVFNNEVGENKAWGWYKTSVGGTSDGIGLGKVNTAAVLTKGIPTDRPNNIWQYITDLNNANTGGCNDWFIGSKAEHDKLRSSGLAGWYSSKYIWSSVEYSAAYAYDWFYYDSNWHNNSKITTICCVGFRAF